LSLVYWGLAPTGGRRLSALGFARLPLRKGGGRKPGCAGVCLGHLFYRKRLPAGGQRWHRNGRRDGRDIVLRGGGWNPGAGGFGVPGARWRSLGGLGPYPIPREEIPARLRRLGSGGFWRAADLLVIGSDFREPGGRLRRGSFRDFERLGGFPFRFRASRLGWRFRGLRFSGIRNG